MQDMCSKTKAYYEISNFVAMQTEKNFESVSVWILKVLGTTGDKNGNV